MADRSLLNDALGRLRNIFCWMAGTELIDTDLAALTRLDDEECRILLGVLQEFDAVERRIDYAQGYHIGDPRPVAETFARL